MDGHRRSTSSLAAEHSLTPGRKRLEAIAQRLRANNTGAFLDVALSKAVLSDEVSTKAPLFRRLRQRSTPPSGCASPAPASAGSQSRLRREAARDVSADDVSVGLNEWRVPMRCYAWGCGTGGQLGCGTVAGLPAFQRASRPLLVNFGFADQGPGAPRAGADGYSAAAAEITPIRVACGDGCTAFIDNTRRLYTCGTGWMGHHVADRPDRVRVPTRVMALGSAAMAGARGVLSTWVLKSASPQINASSLPEVAFGGGFVIACSVDGAVWCEDAAPAAVLASVDRRCLPPPYVPPLSQVLGREPSVPGRVLGRPPGPRARRGGGIPQHGSACRRAFFWAPSIGRRRRPWHVRLACQLT